MLASTTLAPSVYVPGVLGARTPMARKEVLPRGRLPIWHVTTPAAWEQPGLAARKVSPACSTWVSLTLSAVVLPLFLTCKMYEKGLARPTWLDVAEAVTWTSVAVGALGTIAGAGATGVTLLDGADAALV